MKIYNKKELLSKLNEGYDLKDEEYKALIKNGKYEMMNKIMMMASDAYAPTLFNYVALGTLAGSLDYAEDEEKIMPRACIYMTASLGQNITHYTEGYYDGNIAFDRLCRYNTHNFIKEVAEIHNFDSLIGNLYDSINEIVEYGYTYSSKDDLKERMEELDYSRNKIKVLRNKYIK